MILVFQTVRFCYAVVYISIKRSSNIDIYPSRVVQSLCACTCCFTGRCLIDATRGIQIKSLLTSSSVSGDTRPGLCQSEGMHVWKTSINTGLCFNLVIYPAGALQPTAGPSLKAAGDWTLLCWYYRDAVVMERAVLQWVYRSTVQCKQLKTKWKYEVFAFYLPVRFSWKPTIWYLTQRRHWADIILTPESQLIRTDSLQIGCNLVFQSEDGRTLIICLDNQRSGSTAGTRASHSFPWFEFTAWLISKRSV